MPTHGSSVDVDVGGGAKTSKSLYNSNQSTFENYLHQYVNEPLLNTCVPYSTDPNHISYVNAAVCWCILLLSYVALWIEESSPNLCYFLRLLLAALIFVTIVLDCLDGMQARRSKRTSKLGEVLDHSLDAANSAIMSASMVLILDPDVYTIAISLLATGMIYNAQLVIFRHQGVMINPPTSGPEAQMLVVLAIVIFSTLWLYVSHTSYAATVIVTVFSIVGNLSQMNNVWFYWKLLKNQFESDHSSSFLRYSVQALIFSALLLGGFINKYAFILCAVLLSYRLNGQYLLYTMASKTSYNKEKIQQLLTHTDKEWSMELMAWFIVILSTGSAYFQHFSSLFSTLNSILPLIFAVHMFAENVQELIHFKPALTSS
jgi:phosphatidylglycerophosphate synthase